VDIVLMQARTRRLNGLATIASIVVLMSGAALAQFGFGGIDGSYRPLPNIPYDGRFTFVRVRYSHAPGGYWPGRRPSWIHGYPLAERNLMQIMNEVSFIGAHDEVNTVTLVFHNFFEINGIDHFPQAYVSGDPVFKGIFEGNDRRKRLMAIINYNTDVSQYWEWSGRGFRPFDQTNEAYKLGVNYLIYGLTH
jgi:hypothetical protein